MTLRRTAALCASIALIPLTYAEAARQRPTFDALAPRGPVLPAAAAPRAAQGRIRPGTSLHMAERLGVPSFLWAPKEKSKAAAPAGPARRPEQAARAHLAEYAELYHLTGQDIEELEVSAVHDTGRGGVIVAFKRSFDGVDVFRDEMKVLMGRDLGLMALSGYLPGRSSLPAGASSHSFRISAAEAVALAYEDLTSLPLSASDLRRSGARPGGYELLEMKPYAAASAAPFASPARARKVYFHLPAGLEPAWHVELDVAGDEESDSDVYAYVYSAAGEELLFRHNLTVSDSFSYRVWAETAGERVVLEGPQGTSAAPHPTGLPDGFQSSFTLPSLVTLQNGPISTNDPWLPPGATQTVGNNVDAYADLVSLDGFTQGDFRADVTSPGVFDRTYNTSQAATASQTQQKASITQLFYDTNFLHDWFYDHGFDEASRNAQASNFGRGGLEGDSMKAEAQDFSGRNNANMSTPSDGGRPRMQMYVFDGVGNRSLTVNAPAGVAGVYQVGIAAFGLSMFDVTGDVVAVVDTSAPISDGCTLPWVNEAQVVGNIALIDRGNCAFTVKVANAENAGAIGVIIANNVSGILNMGGTTPVSFTPAVLISLEDGNLIKNAMTSSTVNVRLFRQFAPARDGTIDNQIVAHEWGHYISNRLIGDGSGLVNQQGAGMGEGWGDFHALLITARPEDALAAAGADFDGVYAMAGYVTSGGANGADLNQGYYFGIRRVPYSTDFTKNPLTLRHIANGQALPPGVPIAFDASGANNAEVHNAGEIWATMLWECYASLLRDTLGPAPRLTFEQARQRMLGYLVAGYKMTPVTPTFLEARDAVLAAAQAADSTDYGLFAQAFARRGAGVGAVAPDRFSATNSPVVESFVTGGDLAAEEVTLQDDLSTQCLPDGDLDALESGLLRVTYRNTGTLALSSSTVTVTTTHPDVSFPAGNSTSLPSVSPGATATASIPVLLGPVGGIQSLDFTLQVDDPGFAIPGPRTINRSFRANADDVAAASATDDVESAFTQWTPGSNPALDTSQPWRRVEITGSDHRLLGPDGPAPSDQYLISPPLQVGATGSFGFTFRHRHNFEFDASNRYDGGVIELSTDGGANWTDIGGSASPGYNGILASGGSNPLQGRNAFTAASSGYPALVPVTVSLGTAYQGQSVRVRFRIGTDLLVSAPGWEIDDVAFSNITNTPFNVLVPHTGACDSDDDGFFDAQDCSSGDPSLWSPPGEALDLMVTGGGTADLAWSAPLQPGGTALLYDVLKSSSGGDFMTAECLASDQPGLTAADPVAGPGTISYYLVRSQNGCGSSLGSSSSGAPRAGRGCP